MKIIENMRIHTKLLLNSVIAIISLIIIGLIGVFHSHHIAGVTMSLIETETIPIFKINALKQSTWQVMQQLTTYIQINDNNKQKQLIQEIEYEQEQIKKQIRMIEQLYQHIGDIEPHQEYWFDFKHYWQKLKQINQHIIEKSHQQGLQLFLDKAQPTHQKILAALHQLVDTHNQHLKAQSAAAKAAKNWAVWIITLLTILISISMIYIMNRFSQRLLAPLNHVNEHLKTLAQGELNSVPLNYSGRDEISEIVISVQKLKNSIQSTIEQTKAIAAGDYHHEVQLHSKHDQLGHALLEMMQALRQATAKNQIQDWLKSGQAQLNDAMSGEQDIMTLGKNIITFLTTYLEAKVGLFYILHHTKPAYIELTASYAYTATESIPERFSLGEGLVGQAALEGRLLTRIQTPEESAHIIQSGLAKAVPSHVLLMPFLYENQVSGIIELGASQALTEIQQEFLLQVMPSIGIAVNTARSRTQMQELLEQSQLQAEKLTNQTEELKAQQLEMQQVNEELQVQQEEMKQVNEELQTQAEELQAQQEELRQTNEELEERTRELERQKQAIHDKNQALEKTQVEMEQAKEAIEIKAKELELASKYKSEFLANMSHELRTPLNSLLILAQLLAENKNGNLTEKQQEYAKTIHSAGSDLLTLINEILDLSKVEAGKMEVHLEDVVLSDLLKTIEPKFRHVAEEKDLQFEIHFGDQLPAELYTDAQRLKQIINNLLSNAFKFTEQGSVQLTIQRPTAEEKLTGLEHDKTLAIRVSDSGIGIPKDKQKLIFEAFQQADGTTNRRFGGTGLGLSISRQLARLLGGELCLASEEGQGSTFTLYVPQTFPSAQGLVEQPPSKQPAAPTPPSTQPAAEPEPLPKETVLDDRENIQAGDKSLLIVEDDRKFSSILMELARDKGFKCIMAEDGKTGLHLAETYKPNAIILDVSLPKVDGWTVMERLKDNPEIRHIPVHFMSAFDQSLDALRMGAIGYLLKPVNMEQLSQAFGKIEQFLAKTVKNLLVVADDEQHQQSILNLIGSQGIKIQTVSKSEEAINTLRQNQFECIVVDVDIENRSGIQLLQQLAKTEQQLHIPVILYAERELTLEEDNLLQQCTDTLTVKAVQSPERLLDEATLFLHQIEAHLPQEKQQMLKMVHDKTAILMNKKVLVVDDDIRNTFALTTVLEDKDMEVIMAQNGKEALATLDNHPDTDIVLMDIMMPEMDGYETMRKIRAQNRFRKLPIIALTAKAMKGDKAKCIEAGANDYLSKPVDTDKLISLMRVWLYR